MRTLKNQTIEETLLSRSHWIPFTGCLIWTGACDRDGYGYFNKGGKRIAAHRISYALHKGEPKNFVCHSCDVPACINPDHLYDGTNSDNMQDRSRRGRAKMAEGMSHGMSKYADGEIRLMRAMWKDGMTLRQIADTFGANGTSNIWKIVAGKTWKHV